jgi:glycosyltransferase involved in cell wall biosynthesis
VLKLGIIVPCYNEEEALPETNRRLIEVINNLVRLGKITTDSMIFYVDDGSTDGTWQLIESLIIVNSLHISGIKLSRNYGHQNAIIAGLFSAAGDALITIDADLQDDVNAIEAMIDKYLAGSEIVYGVRNNRESDSVFKRLTASIFYSVMKILGAEVVKNHADFRLLSRNAINSLQEFREVSLFLRGIVPLIGLSSATVHYSRDRRLLGQSKYPLRKMLNFAVDGITSFSIVPLRIVTITGLFIFILSLIMSTYVMFLWLFTDDALPGWSSIVLPMYLLGGVQVLFLGIFGEYLGKIYGEVKDRPRYIIEKRTFK